MGEYREGALVSSVRSVEFHPEAEAEFIAAARYYDAQAENLGLDFISAVELQLAGRQALCPAAERPLRWTARKNAMVQAPRITHLAWSEMEVEGLDPACDMKLWPGGGRPWDWRETGTHHVPGIQVADVEELLENGARTVVLTRGMELVLQTCPETLEYLGSRGIQFYVAETNEAAQIYNELIERGEAVGALFHSTC